MVGCGPRQGRLCLTTGEDSKLPWHRVLNHAGRISYHLVLATKGKCTLLEQEGVEFILKRRVDLKRFGWENIAQHGTNHRVPTLILYAKAQVNVEIGKLRVVARPARLLPLLR